MDDRYNWNRLNHLQLGRYAEYFTKMEFTLTEVKAAFRGIYGVGEQIANLSVLLLEYRYGVRFSDLDHSKMDIQADLHTCRVLSRLGIAIDGSPGDAVAAARRLHPAYPGDLDAPLVMIDRIRCHPSQPECQACPLAGVCSYATAWIGLATDTGILTAG